MLRIECPAMHVRLCGIDTAGILGGIRGKACYYQKHVGAVMVETTVGDTTLTGLSMAFTTQSVRKTCFSMSVHDFDDLSAF